MKITNVLNILHYEFFTFYLQGEIRFAYFHEKVIKLQCLSITIKQCDAYTHPLWKNVVILKLIGHYHWQFYQSIDKVKKYNYLTCATSPTTKSPIWICIASPFLITLNVCSPSIRSWRPLNCLSFDQSLNAVTTTTITTAIKIAAPSIQAWCSSSSGSSIKMNNSRYRKMRL